MPRLRTHPGSMLRAELEARGVTANQLAIAIRVPANRITAILRGERAVTAETAVRLGRHLGTGAAFWMNLQTQFDISVIETTKGHDRSGTRRSRVVLSGRTTDTCPANTDRYERVERSTRPAVAEHRVRRRPGAAHTPRGTPSHARDALPPYIGRDLDHATSLRADLRVPRRCVVRSRTPGA